MLEGFMESVRAMTDVVLDNKQNSGTSEIITPDAGTRNITGNASGSDLTGTVNTEQSEATIGRNIQNSNPEQTENGFLEKIRRGIMSFLRLFSKSQN